MASALRCIDCRKAFRSAVEFDSHACSGPQSASDVETHAIVVPEGEGVYCHVCERRRRTVWLEPDFCCATCKLVLLTVGTLN